MSITKILNDEKVTTEEKLQRVAEIVASARQKYGNEEAEIQSPVINTPHGAMNFNHLEDDSKVELLKGTVQYIKAQAVEFAEQNEGVNFNKKIEELIATNPMFVNISAGTKFDYI